MIWGITLPALFDPTLALKFGADFVHFYTLGWVALHRAGEALYDPAALSAAQAALVPALSDRLYLPLYPPQAALIFAPFAMLPYGAASALWVIASIVGYLVVIRLAARPDQFVPDPVLLWAAAVAFPPFWYLVMFRQNSVIVLAVLFIGSRLLEREQPALAGVALGFLALKPQFGIPFAVVAVYRRDLSLIGGAVFSALVQGLIAMAVFGADVVVDYVRYLPRVLATANAVEPVLYKSLSLRTLSRLLPTPIGEVLWAVACVAVLLALLRVSRIRVPVRQYLAVMILASVLVNPHVYVYDGVVLALPFIWLGEWRVERNQGRLFLYQALGFWFAAILMMPLTLAIGSLAAVGVTISAILALGIFFWSSVRDLIDQYTDAPPRSLVPASG